MQWHDHTFAQAVRNATKSLRDSTVFDDAARARALNDLLRHVAATLPRHWAPQFRHRFADRDADTFVSAIVEDERSVLDPDQFAVLEALRFLAETLSQARSRSILASAQPPLSLESTASPVSNVPAPDLVLKVTSAPPPAVTA